MSSIVLELQQELLDKNCDILQALRKAHVIATKLHLTEFDAWIQNELNGYKSEDENFPEYRQMKGTLKAKNPVRGWIPAVITNKDNEAFLNSVPVFESISALIDLKDRSPDGYFYYTYPMEYMMKMFSTANAPAYEVALFICTIHITELIDKVKNLLLDWTLELERKGILGNDMFFNENETSSAKEVSQQINNYYGTVVNGSVSSSQIVSGNNNSVTYDASLVKDAVKEIRDSLNNESISEEDKDTALEILEDISSKLDQNKKPGIIKSALLGLKDFIIATGADITAALIMAKIQGLF